MTRRERIEARMADAYKYGHVSPFGTGRGYRDVEIELRALWAVVDAEMAYQRGEGGINSELRAADALNAALDAYHAADQEQG